MLNCSGTCSYASGAPPAVRSSMAARIVSRRGAVKETVVTRGARLAPALLHLARTGGAVMKAVMTVVAALSVAALPLAGGAVAQTSGSQPAPKQPGYQAPAAEKPAQGIRPVEKPDELGLW